MWRADRYIHKLLSGPKSLTSIFCKVGDISTIYYTLVIGSLVMFVLLWEIFIGLNSYTSRIVFVVLWEISCVWLMYWVELVYFPLVYFPLLNYYRGYSIFPILFYLFLFVSPILSPHTYFIIHSPLIPYYKKNTYIHLNLLLHLPLPSSTTTTTTHTPSPLPSTSLSSWPLTDEGRGEEDWSTRRPPTPSSPLMLCARFIMVTVLVERERGGRVGGRNGGQLFLHQTVTGASSAEA